MIRMDNFAETRANNLANFVSKKFSKGLVGIDDSAVDGGDKCRHHSVLYDVAKQSVIGAETERTGGRDLMFNEDHQAAWADQLNDYLLETMWTDSSSQLQCNNIP